MILKIPATEDIIQETEGNLKIPEIRVWCHPHKIGKSGDDYYYIFESFEKAIEFIKTHKEAEDIPLIAFKGYEMNIFEIKEVKYYARQGRNRPKSKKLETEGPKDGKRVR